MYQRMFEAEKEYDELLVDKKLPWRVCYDSKKKGSELKYEQATSTRGMQTLRVRCLFDHPPVVVMKGYLNKETRIAYDDNIQDAVTFGQPGANLFQSFQITRKIAIISSRDLYIHYWINVLPNGSYKLICHEIDAPAVKGKVRMRMPIGGLTVNPDPNDPNKSIVEHIIEADLQGNIPQWVWSMAIK